MNALFVCEETTAGVTVSVRPSFLEAESNPAHGRYIWSYHIRLSNDRQDAVQLIDRHWTIVDARGRVEEVRGPGVVGAQPLLKSGESFDYVSGCPLGTPSGLMHGEYGFIDAEGMPFVVAIPAFSLDSPYAARAH